MIEAIGPGDPPLDELGRALAVGDRVVPAPNLTCGRCRFCLDERYPYYLCARADDYGNSLTCAQPPHLFGGWSELMYLLPGTRLFRVPDGLPSELAALTEVIAVTHGLDAARALDGTGGGFRFGDTVLVLGVGPLGLMHLAKAELLGAGRLMAIDVFASRLEVAPRRSAPTCCSTRRRRARSERLDAVPRGDGRLRRRRRRRLHRPRGRRSPRRSSWCGPGGTVIEPGTFVDMGRRPGEPEPRRLHEGRDGARDRRRDAAQQYGPALRMLDRHADRLPFARLVTHRVGARRGRRRARARAGRKR